MEQNGTTYTAEDGMTIRRKADSFIMGRWIDLGVKDSIDNYDEVKLTEETESEKALSSVDIPSIELPSFFNIKEIEP